MAKVARKAPKKTLPKEMTVRHVRAPDYREYRAEGMLQRLEGADLILTYFINDVVVTEEVLTILEQNEQFASYVTAKVSEEKQRTDLLAIRMPVDQLLASADAIRKILESKK